jgi:hypothetical protein
MKWRLTALLASVALWLGPFSIAGIAKKQFFKREFPSFATQHALAGLFTLRNQTWQQVQFQVKTSRSASWLTLSTAELSPIGVLGYRQRLDRVILLTNGKGKAADETHARVATWIARAYALRHVEAHNVTAVRITQTAWTTNTPELAQPAGHWEVNPAILPTSAHKTTLATFTIKNGKAVALSPAKTGTSNQKTPSVKTVPP